MWGNIDWISVAESGLPKEPGMYLVHCPTADPDKPLMVTCWFESDPEHPPLGWGLVEVFKDKVTHWCKPIPPKTSN
jgi:hypothetical protein